MSTFSLVLLLMGAILFPAQAQVDSASTDNREVFTVVEQPPQFPGGMNKLGNYIQKNLMYPTAARLAKLEGRVFITFIVTDQGRIEEVRSLNSLGKGTDEEAIRLVQSMPNWIPGRQSGRPVTVRYNLPINFSLR